MYDNNNYGSVITEQGDLGLGVTPINESAKSKSCPHCGSELKHSISGDTEFSTCRTCGWKKAY